MKSFLTILFICSGLFTTGQLSDNTPPEGIQWNSIQDISTLKDSDKKTLVFIYTDWCKWCKEMQESSFNDPEVTSFINEHFKAIKFNGESNKNISYKDKVYTLKKENNLLFHELTYEFNRGNISYPSLVFLDDDLNMIQAINGFRNKEDILKILKYIEGEYYTKTSWNNYLKGYKKQP